MTSSPRTPWLDAAACPAGRPCGAPTRGRAQGPGGPGLHRRVRRRRDPPRGPARRAPGTSRALARDDAALPAVAPARRASGSVRPSPPWSPRPGHPGRAPRAAPDGRPPARRRHRAPPGQGDRPDPRQRDVRLNINLLGEAVLGEAEAGRRLAGTHRLLARHDVDYVSIKVSATVAAALAVGLRRGRRAHRREPARRCSRLAAEPPTPKFINLDMEEYRDLDLTIAVFTRLLDRPELHGPRGRDRAPGVPPRRAGAMIRLQDWAADAPRPRWRRHQGARGQGRQPADGAGRGGAARLAAGDLGDASRSPTPTTSASSTTRCTPSGSPTCGSASPGTTSSTSRTPGCSPGAAASATASSSRCCSAWPRARPRPSRRDGRRAPALHPGRAPAGVRRRDRLPGTPPRGGREPGQLHVGGLRPARRRALFERERDRFLASLEALDDAVPAAEPRAGPARQPVAARPRRRASPTPPTPTRRCPATARWGRAITAPDRAARRWATTSSRDAHR